MSTAFFGDFRDLFSEAHNRWIARQSLLSTLFWVLGTPYCHVGGCPLNLRDVPQIMDGTSHWLFQEERNHERRERHENGGREKIGLQDGNLLDAVERQYPLPVTWLPVTWLPVGGPRHPWAPPVWSGGILGTG